MAIAVKDWAGGEISEMAIVNTFTRLIFGDAGELSSPELAIIQALREVDANVLHDSHSDMGEYLRQLGVREMIHLVARLRQHFEDGVAATVPGNSNSRLPTQAITAASRARR